MNEGRARPRPKHCPSPALNFEAARKIMFKLGPRAFLEKLNPSVVGFLKATPAGPIISGLDSQA